MIVEESKDRYIRILEYKYLRVCLVLESLMDKIKSGQMINLEILGDANDVLKLDPMSQYRKFLLNKYPMKTFQNYMNFNQNIDILKKKRSPFYNLNTNNYSHTQIPNPTGLDSQINYRLNQPEPSSSDFIRMSKRVMFNRFGDKFEDSFQEEAPNWLLEDKFYDNLLKKRAEMMEQYESEISKQRELDKQCFELMNKLNDRSTPLNEMVDGFVNYKINRYRSKIEVAIKKAKGEVTCDSDIIMDDILEPQYFVNSISDKLIDQHNYLIEPFRQTYALKEIKNAIKDRFTNYSRFNGLSNDFLAQVEQDRIQRIESMQKREIEMMRNNLEYKKFIRQEQESVEQMRRKIQQVGLQQQQQSYDQTDSIYAGQDSGGIRTRSSSMDDQVKTDLQQREFQQSAFSSFSWKQFLFMPLIPGARPDPLSIYAIEKIKNFKRGGQ